MEWHYAHHFESPTSETAGITIVSSILGSFELDTVISREPDSWI